MKSTTIVCISDTHNLHENIALPRGDVLVHAGDLTGHGDLKEVEKFNAWLGAQPHPVKIVIAGNHDFCFERQPQAARALLTNCIYLEDSGVTVEGIRFWGTPWQPWFFDWAFNLHRGTPELIAKWNLIPEDTDVLITHGPPLGQRDRTIRGENVGCADLLQRIQTIRPSLNCFGHIHEGYGKCSDPHTLYANASVCNLSYEPINEPFVFVWRDGSLVLGSN